MPYFGNSFSPFKGERLREQTVGVKRFSLAGTTVSLCKNKEMGVHIPLRHKRPPLNSISNTAPQGGVPPTAKKDIKKRPVESSGRFLLG